MAKVYFRYGTMGSGKTLNLLAVAHNYEQQGKRILIVKPEIDVRFGASLVKSRTGLSRQADIFVSANSTFAPEKLENIDCILVDEAQFLSSNIVEQLRNISLSLDIPVLFYGLRTDFRGELFEGSKRIMELADSIEEVKTTCAYCNRKAIFNMKIVCGSPSLQGPTVELGAEEKYLPACVSCYKTRARPNWASHLEVL